MKDRDAGGFLFVGDPHLATRTPGFRKDDYPRTMVNKLRWCLDYAANENLIPVLLGDIFHFPRDNANWLLVEIFELCTTSRHPVLGVVGNHDCYENCLTVNDTLAVVRSGGGLGLIDSNTPWIASMSETLVVVGGTPWNERLPGTLPAEIANSMSSNNHVPKLVLWLTHHDIAFAGYEENARTRPTPIPGIDVVINGHIHRPLPDIRMGGTTWLNPGNIARVTRSENTRQRLPEVLRMDIKQGHWSTSRIAIPCLPFDEVFYELPEVESKISNRQSVFVTGLAQLEAFKTATGAGLMHFLDSNLAEFPEPVQNEIRILANEVLNNEADINE